MSLSHTEDLLLALEDYVEANLSTRLTAITNDIADGLDLPEVKDFILGATTLERYHNWPLGFIVPISDTWESLTMGVDELSVDCDLWVIAAGYDEETLYRQVLRYAAGLYNAIDDDPSLNDGIGEATVTTVEYFPRVAGVDGARGARMRITMTQEV